MRRRSPIKTLFALGIGAAIVGLLLAGQDFDQIGRMLGTVGGHFFWIVGYRFLPIAADAWGWRLLMANHGPLPGFMRFVRLRWLVESCNTLLPTAQVGGHILRAMLLARSGVDSARAGAGVAIDFIIGSATQFFFVGAGVLLWAVSRQDRPAAGLITGGFMAVAGIVAIFFLCRYGRRRTRLTQFGKALVQWIFRRGAVRPQRMEAEIKHLFERPRRLAACSGVRLGGWILKAGEVYLGLYWMGYPVSLLDAVLLEAAAVAASNAGFWLPGALGLREGGIVAAGVWMGISIEVCMTLSLIKRARELAVGLPGITALSLSRHLWRKARTPAETTDSSAP